MKAHLPVPAGRGWKVLLHLISKGAVDHSQQELQLHKTNGSIPLAWTLDCTIRVPHGAENRGRDNIG